MIGIAWVNYTWSYARDLPLRVVQPLQALYHRMAGEMTPAIDDFFEKA